MALEVGQKVRALKDLYDSPDGDSPGGYLCYKDDLLVVRETGSTFWNAHVSHEHITNNSFGVNTNEVELIE